MVQPISARPPFTSGTDGLEILFVLPLLPLEALYNLSLLLVDIVLFIASARNLKERKKE